MAQGKPILRRIIARLLKGSPVLRFSMNDGMPVELLAERDPARFGRLAERDAVPQKLNDAGYMSRPAWVPMHMLKSIPIVHGTIWEPRKRFSGA